MKDAHATDGWTKKTLLTLEACEVRRNLEHVRNRLRKIISNVMDVLQAVDSEQPAELTKAFAVLART